MFRLACIQTYIVSVVNLVAIAGVLVDWRIWPVQRRTIKLFARATTLPTINAYRRARQLLNPAALIRSS